MHHNYHTARQMLQQEPTQTADDASDAMNSSSTMPMMEMAASTSAHVLNSRGIRRLSRSPIAKALGAPVTAMAEDESAMNLSRRCNLAPRTVNASSQMLVEEPDNQNLVDLRDQLTNAINQLQGTKNMVQRAQSNRQPGLGGMPNAEVPVGMGADALRHKAHSSRKNKPQRCSICGGIGHKSRTCTMAMQQQSQQQNQAHVHGRVEARRACSSKRSRAR